MKTNKLKLEDIISIALKNAHNGKVCSELKLLHRTPYRSKVDWSMFPDWCCPSVPEEFTCHEG